MIPLTNKNIVKGATMKFAKLAFFKEEITALSGWCVLI
jgi:hypothetical protein